MRFRQQVHEIEIDVPSKALEGTDIDALVNAFEETYERIYGKGSALRMSGVEFTVLRTEAISPVTKPSPAPLPRTDANVEATSTRKVFFYQLGFRDTKIYRAENLGPGTVISGPAIVERPDTTVVVGPGQRLEVEPFGNMIITLSAGSH
jgi:N-methylhydantoinase A